MNVKFDSIFTLLAILLAAILGYWLYDLSTDVNVKWVIAIGGFLSIASMLVPLMGAKFDDSKITISVKTASTLFLVIILIENFCFATFGTRIPLYIIITALSMLIAVAVVYRLSQTKDI